jgi:aspartate aminotransferase
MQSHSTSNPTSFAQKGAIAALKGPETHLAGWLEEFSKRREFAWEKINSIPRLSCVKSQGAFYLFPNISQTGLDSTKFCERFLAEQKVAAVPGKAFGADNYFRISYATDLATIKKGLDRLEQFVKSLP